MIKKLHPAQQKLLSILSTNINDPLTIREIRDLMGASSTSVVTHHIRQLENKGFLRRNPSNPKDYQVLADNPDKKITYLNQYGLAHCGENGNILDGDPVDRISISSKLLGFQASKAFLVKAKGNSMTPKIKDGDMVLAKKSGMANDDDIVVAVNNGEALIKKIKKQGDKVILISTNQDYETFIANDDFHIEGIVKSVISYY